MRTFIISLVAITTVTACHEPARVDFYDDGTGDLTGDDLDGNGVTDIGQAVIVASDSSGSGMCTVLHKPMQAADPSCNDLWARGYGGGAYEAWDDGTTNWEDGFLKFWSVTNQGDGSMWCGAQFRPDQDYRITTATAEAILYQQDGWSDHLLGATAEAGDFRWVKTRSEGYGDACYHEVTNIAFGCDSTGHVYEVDGASLGERDPNCE